MSISPDQSRFTACVIGEGTPTEQAAFDAALLADPSLRGEAVTLSRTAHRLTTTLKGGALPSLTSSQRHHVLHQTGGKSTAPARKSSRPAWFGPTLATTGLAAALALGLYAVPATDSAPPASSPPPETRIPAVAIQNGPPLNPSARPLTPAPALEHGPITAPLPAPPGLSSPVQIDRQASIAASAPTLQVAPLPVPSTREARRDPSPPGRPLPGQKTAPVESLASPRVLPP